MAKKYSLFLVNYDGTEGSLGPSDLCRHISVKEVTELGDVLSASTFVKRDLGYQGKLGPYILLTYGDTMFSTAEGDDEFRGMTCNSAAFACEEATCVFDPVLDDNDYPRCLLQPTQDYGEDPSVDSLGITNVIETSPGEGMFTPSCSTYPVQ